jgi:DNA-binding transcriptional MocR family regulator
VDLHLDLAGSRIGEALERALRDATRTGRLAPGLQLPSSRALAADLGLARNTVTGAYSKLIAQGWLTSRPGAGTYVADRSAAVEAATASAPPASRPAYDLRAGVVAVKTLTDRHTGSLDQLTFAEFISSGHYDRQVRRSRLAYRRRRDRLVDALRRDAPRVQITGIAAGLHLLLELPDSHTEHDIVTRAARSGLAIEGLGAYQRTPGTHPPALVVGYGTPHDHAFTGAIARLTAALGGTGRRRAGPGR